MTESELLAKRAERFREAILEVACGPGGMIISFARFDNRRPFQEGEMSEDDYRWGHAMNSAWGGYIATPRPTLAEWWYGENTLWVEGWLLWSQMLRYQTTKEPEALETARKCFLDLHNMFRLSAMIQPGCLGKPHGGRPGVTTSFDQSAFPVLPYAWYTRDYAEGKLKDEAVENLRQYGLNFLRQNMIVNHHGHLGSCVAEPHGSSMKYLAAMYASYEISGEKDVRDTVIKYVQKIVDAGILPWMTQPAEISGNLFYYGFLSDYWMKTELADMMDWKSNIKVYWEAAKSALDEDGLPMAGDYDTVNKTFTPTKEEWVYLSDPSGKSGEALKYWKSPKHYPAKANFACTTSVLGLIARSHGFDDDAHLSGKKALMRIDEDCLRHWWHWGDEDRFPEAFKPLLNMFAPEAAANWLALYWYGRLQNLW